MSQKLLKYSIRHLIMAPSLSSLHSADFPHIPASAELLHPLRKLLTQNANERTLAMQSGRGTRPKLFLTMLLCLL